ERDHATGCFLAGFYAWLVVGVDANERSVETDGPFIEGDQQTDGLGRTLGHGNRDGVTVAFAKRIAGAEQKALEKIAAGDTGLHFKGLIGDAVLQYFDESDEEIIHAVAELLDVGVLVGRAFVAVNGNALVDDV